MRTLKLILLYIVIFTATFISSGESYIYYLDSAANDCDYYFECKIQSPELRECFAKEIQESNKKLDLLIYAVDYKPISGSSARYTVYTPDAQTKAFLKDKFKTGNKANFKSLFSGNIEVEYKAINELKNLPGLNIYNVIGNEQKFEKFRSETIDTYGTGKAYNGSYKGDHIFILTVTWMLTYIIISLISLAESAMLRKEVCIKYINGHRWRDIVIIEILKNGMILLISALISVSFASVFTETLIYGKDMILAVFGLLIVSTGIFVWDLKCIDIKKIFARVSQQSKLQKYMSKGLFTFSMVLFMVSITMCVQNIDNAKMTMRQEKIWREYDGYKSIVFFSGEESDTANHDLDNQYAAEFYNQNVDTYDISLAFNIAENGGMQENYLTGDSTIVYMNLNGAKKCDLPIDLSKLAPDTAYIILPHTNKESTDKKVDYDLQRILQQLNEGEKNFDIKYKVIEDEYEVTLLDIKNKDLARNIVKNPVIIVDTNNKISKSFAANVCTSIMNFKDEKSFKNFIEEINYENQVWYEEDVYEVYKAKRDKSSMTATINLFIALFLLVLFYISLFFALKIEFRCNANEISIKKTLGASVANRYSAIVKVVLVNSVIISIILLVLNQLFNFANNKFVLYVLGVVYVLVYVLFLIYVNVYENHNVSRTLKGGY